MDNHKQSFSAELLPNQVPVQLYPVHKYSRLTICSGGWTWTTDLKVIGIAS